MRFAVFSQYLFARRVNAVMTNSTLEAGFILYYIFGILSILGNTYVSVTLARMGLLTSPTKLVLYLHLTLILENISTFPNIFNTDSRLCEFVALVRTYSGLANSFVVLCLVLLYRYWFVEDKWKILPLVTKNREFIIFGLPLISLFPFITNSYGDSHSYFCTLKRDDVSDKVWGLVLYVFLLAVAISLSCAIMSQTVINVLITDSRYASKLFRSVGFYATFSIISWIPRALAQVGVLSYLSTFYLTYISGILYVIVFFYERESFKAYEQNSAFNPDLREASDRDSEYFSWDISPFSSNQSATTLRQASSDNSADRSSVSKGIGDFKTIQRNSAPRRSIKMELSRNSRITENPIMDSARSSSSNRHTGTDFENQDYDVEMRSSEL